MIFKKSCFRLLSYGKKYIKNEISAQKIYSDIMLAYKGIERYYREKHLFYIAIGGGMVLFSWFVQEFKDRSPSTRDRESQQEICRSASWIYNLYKYFYNNLKGYIWSANFSLKEFHIR